MADNEKGKIWITDFNDSYLKYITPKPKDKTETKLKIRSLKKSIERKLKENKTIATQKRLLTISLNKGTLNYITYNKQYNLLTAESFKNKIDIQDNIEIIKNLENNKDAKIRFKGIFARANITRSYLMSLKNPALHLLKLDLNACERKIDNPNFEMVNTERQQNGVNKQYSRIMLNIQLVQGKEEDREDEYPIEVIITPSRILFL